MKSRPLERDQATSGYRRPVAEPGIGVRTPAASTSSTLQRRRARTGTAQAAGAVGRGNDLRIEAHLGGAPRARVPDEVVALVEHHEPVRHGPGHPSPPGTRAPLSNVTSPSTDTSCTPVISVQSAVRPRQPHAAVGRRRHEEMGRAEPRRAAIERQRDREHRRRAVNHGREDDVAAGDEQLRAAARQRPHAPRDTPPTPRVDRRQPVGVREEDERAGGRLRGRGPEGPAASRSTPSGPLRPTRPDRSSARS